jgi:hypothetical protein
MSGPLALQSPLELGQQAPDFGDLGCLVPVLPSSAAGLTRASQVLAALLQRQQHPLLFRQLMAGVELISESIEEGGARRGRDMPRNSRSLSGERGEEAVSYMSSGLGRSVYWPITGITSGEATQRWLERGLRGQGVLPHRVPVRAAMDRAQ